MATKSTRVRLPLWGTGVFSVLTISSAFLSPCYTTPSLRVDPSRYASSNDDEGRGSIDEMRRILEASWDVSTMGSVPTNADSAADAAVTAVRNAVGRSSNRLFYVDLLLPQYDIRQGSNLYDDVLAVEFCIALSNRLNGKTTIVVRDDKTIKTVSRILEARERDRQPANDRGSPESHVQQNAEDDDDEEADEDQFFDEFSELGLIGGSSDVESFREQLISGWKTEDLETGSTASAIKQSDSVVSGPSRSYRLASMLGSESISPGADMVKDVVRAVSANAQPNEDEETLIILSATSVEEMIGVRGLVSKYEGEKTILLVNCYLDPCPRELMRAQTVYSIQPFIARPKVSDTNIFGGAQAQQPPDATTAKPPKVVVMRRFPRDWEIFVDIGSGFELARTVTSNQLGNSKYGPPMDFIASCVKQFMQSRL